MGDLDGCAEWSIDEHFTILSYKLFTIISSSVHFQEDIADASKFYLQELLQMH